MNDADGYCALHGAHYGPICPSCTADNYARIVRRQTIRRTHRRRIRLNADAMYTLRLVAYATAGAALIWLFACIVLGYGR